MIALTSCNKKGCTDPQATNYNEHAQADDGTCNYESQYENLITDTRPCNVQILSEVSVVFSGTTLTIEPGTIIKAVPCALIVAPLAMIKHEPQHNSLLYSHQ